MAAVLKYWRLVLAAVLVLLWLFDRSLQYGRGFTAAEAAGRLKMQQMQVEQHALADALRQTRQQQAAAADAAYQAAREQRAAAERIRYVKVPKIVERAVYRNVCLDDDGLHTINQAVADGGG